MARSGASSTVNPAQAPVKNNTKASAKEYQQSGSLMADNMMLYMQQRTQGEDDVDKSNLQANWGVNQQRLHDQYQKNMYLAQQQQQLPHQAQQPQTRQQQQQQQQSSQQQQQQQRQQQQQSNKRMPQARSYPRQQESGKQMFPTQGTQGPQHGLHPTRNDMVQMQGRHDIQRKQDTTPRQQEPHLHQQLSPRGQQLPLQGYSASTQQHIPHYQNPADAVPDSNGSIPMVNPAMDQQNYLNMMMMQQSPSTLSPSVGPPMGTANTAPSMSQDMGNNDKFRDNLGSWNDV